MGNNVFTGNVTPCDAVAAILTNSKNEILLQHRDNIPNIFFPDYWGLFGGGVELGETAEQALVREIKEELSIDVNSDEATYLTNYTFDFSSWGEGVVYRKFYILDVSRYNLEDFVLKEGQGLDFFGAEEALATLKIAPYDAFALWMYQFERKKEKE